jgi:hypothetical protein
MSYPRIPCLVAAAVMISCGGAPPPGQTADPRPIDGGPVRFNLLEVSAQGADCGGSSTRCARVRVSYLETTGGGTRAVRNNLDLYVQHDLVSRLRGYLSEGTSNRINRLEELTAAFLAEHRAFVEEFPDANADWSIEIAADPIYNSAKVITLDISESAYTGGAHPNSRRQLVTFEVPTGQFLSVEDLASDIETLTVIVEGHFRLVRNLAPDEDLAAAGYWFNDNRFTLPDNIGVVSDGLIFHWNSYEIAPYSMGATSVLVSASDLESVVAQDWW